MDLDGSVSHRGGQQFIGGAGFAGDAFKEVHMLQPHGFASHPVKGGKAAIITAGGRDSAYAVGGENPALRPALEQGGTAIYDAAGNIVSIVASRIRIVHSAEILIVAPLVKIEGELELQGSLKVSGDGEFGGVVTDSDGDGGA